MHALQEKLNLTLIAAHVDHGWREESRQDVLFCKSLAESLQIPFISKHARDIKLIKKPQGSREELGRLLRKQFFEELAHLHKASSITLAHHADDQIETFFIRLMRGAGITGLAGMKVKEGLYVRPLLNLNKEEILNYLEKHAIDYRIDRTNVDQSFLRNKIRHSVIPALTSCDPRFVASFKRTHENIQQAAEFLEHCALQTLKYCSTLDEEESVLYQEKLLSLHPFLRYKVLELWFIQHQVPFIPSQALFAEILRFLKNSKSNSHTLFHEWKLIKKRGTLLLQKT
jgi:tRNA(Ile)-lysidine synthase